MVPAPRSLTTPRSLVLATDIDVLAVDHTVARRDGYLVVRSPTNPTFWFGNFLVFDDAPVPGDGARWERVFEREFADDPHVRHRTLRWDRADDGDADAGTEEFTSRGYDLESVIGLVADPGELVAHPRANQDVQIRRLDPRPGGPDELLWATVIEIQVAARDEQVTEDDYRVFSRTRQAELRALFVAGRGAWYVALTPDGEVAAACGIVATGDRGRFQAVDTAQPHRRRGICSRLVVDVAARAATEHSLRSLVIAADADYHALGLYESLGFRRRERVSSLCRRPANE